MSSKACILMISALTMVCKLLSNVAYCSIKETIEKILTTPTIKFNSTKEFALCFDAETQQNYRSSQLHHTPIK